MKKWIYAVAAMITTLGVSNIAFAQEHDAAGGTALIAIGAGLAIGIAAFGVAFGQGRAVSAALDGIGRNPNAAPKIQTPMILGLAFMEFLCIMAFIVAFLMQQNLA